MRAAAASSRAHETEEVRRFRTCEIGNCFKVEELVMIAEMKSNGFYQLGEISIRTRQKLLIGTCT